ncbi:MAG: lysophospholipid acyltransferase family protein [Acidobacteriota bacterium]
MRDAPLSRRLESIPYLAATHLLLSLPHGAVLRIGRALGTFGYAIDARHRKLVLRNLAWALSERSADERRRLALACYQHVGRAFCEVFSVCRLTESDLRSRFRVEGLEHLQAARAQNRGVMLTSGHFGSWQVAIYPLSLLVGGLHAVARPLDNPYVARHVLRLRQRFGVRVVEWRGAGHRLVNLLRRRAAIGMVVDHRPAPGRGLALPFLGRPARTSSVPAIAAAACGAPVLPTRCTPEGNAGYTIRFDPPIQPGGTDPAAIERLMRAYTRPIEEAVRRQPEMWFWMHDRWKA